MAAAGASLAPWMTGCCRDNYENVTLNVVLHGLFVLNITDCGLELLTPHIHDHIYRVGGWDIRQIYDLKAGKEYELRGTRKPAPTVFPKPVGECAVNITHQDYDFSVDATKSMFSVKLPIPDCVYLLRCVSAPADEAGDDNASTGMNREKTMVSDNQNHNGASRGSNNPRPKVNSKAEYGGYSSNNCIPIKQLSLCQALVYERVPKLCNLKLHGSCWKPCINSYKRIVNLHFWAEPEKRTTPRHANDAYAQLQTLLPPLNLSLQVYTTAPLDEHEVVYGLPPEQEQGWADWASGGGEGTRPTNCCTAMVSQKPITG